MIKGILYSICLCTLFFNVYCIELPELSITSGVVCKSISIPENLPDISSKLSPSLKSCYREKLQQILNNIETASKAEDFESIAADLSEIICDFAQKDKELLEDIYLNVQMRAAMLGSESAMSEIVFMSFTPRPESLSKTLMFKGKELTPDKFLELQHRLDEKLRIRSGGITFSDVISDLP